MTKTTLGRLIWCVTLFISICTLVSPPNGFGANTPAFGITDEGSTKALNSFQDPGGSAGSAGEKKEDKKKDRKEDKKKDKKKDKKDEKKDDKKPPQG